MFDEGFVLGLAFGGGDIKPHTATQNGVYHASDENCDGFDPFTVDLALDGKYITENGVYTASDDELAGYDAVEVNIRIDEKTINSNGTYTAEAPLMGFNPVHVRVPSWEDAKEFYQNGGTGVAGVGGQGYVDALANAILGNGEHVENQNITTGWALTFEPATSGTYPENGMSIHLRNTTLGKNYVLKNISGSWGTPNTYYYRPTYYSIEPTTLAGRTTYMINYGYRLTYNGGATWKTGTSATNTSLNWNDGWNGYLSDSGEYSCTVI